MWACGWCLTIVVYCVASGGISESTSSATSCFRWSWWQDRVGEVIGEGRCSVYSLWRLLAKGLLR